MPDGWSDLPSPEPGWRCRWCDSARGVVVLDLGEQPAADHFPLPDDPLPDPVHLLRMVMCKDCRLAQLEHDPTAAAEPRGVEPQALIEQARAAVADLVGSGLVAEGASVAEFASPHGGSWLGHLAGAGLRSADGPVDLVVDSLGLMHSPDQRAALDARVARLAPGGVLALHVHTLATIVRDGTWNALRHGHFAYYSTPVLVAMVRAAGLVPVGAWRYELYGGTVVVAFARPGAAIVDRGGVGARQVAAVCDAELAAGVTEPTVVGGLGLAAARSSVAVRAYLDEHAGALVVGYGAASRAVSLLAAARATRGDVIAVADASVTKVGRCLPGSRIPIIDLAALEAMHPDRVLLFVPDLLDEVRTALPGIESAGGRWVLVEPEPREVRPIGREGEVVGPT